MELKDFIKQTVKEISESINELEKEGILIDRKGYNTVEFDVSVTVSDSKEMGGGGSIKIAVVNVQGKGAKTESSTEYSRVKFMIHPFHQAVR